MKNASDDSLKIEDQDEISSIIEEIDKNTNDTGKESVNVQLQILMTILSLNFIIKMKKEVQVLCIYIRTKIVAILNSRIQVSGN